MCRRLLVVVGLVGFTAAVQSDDKDPPVKVKGVVTKVDTENGKVTFTFKTKSEDDTVTLGVDKFLLTDTKGKKFEGKAILAELKAGDPIIIPKRGKDGDKIVVIKSNKK